MNESVREYINKYSPDIKELFIKLRTIIYDSISQEVEEKMWAKLPSYYIGDAFVRLIPFKDHINIEALAVARYRGALVTYKITPKGMLQLYIDQEVPVDILKEIFKETLLE